MFSAAARVSGGGLVPKLTFCCSRREDPSWLSGRVAFVPAGGWPRRSGPPLWEHRHPAARLFPCLGREGTGGQGEGCWNWAPEDWPRELRAESSLPPSPGAWHPWKMGGMLLCCSPRAPSILLARSRCWRQPQGPVARRPRTTRLGWRAKRGRRGK